MLFKKMVSIVLCLTFLVTVGCRDMQHQGVDALDTPDSVTPADILPSEPIDSVLVFTDDPGDTFGTDHFVINSATLTGDTLKINVSYGGGCEAHQLTLIASELFLETFPVQLNLSLAHNANGDPCEAWLTEAYLFDLTPIKRFYQESYRAEAGTVILNLEGLPAGLLTYEFDK